MEKISISREFSVLLVIGFLLLTGCAGIGGKNDDKLSINTNFHTGAQGIYMQFLPDAPRAVVYDSPGEGDNEMLVEVEIWNKGAMPSTQLPTNVNLWLGGFDPSIVNLPTHYTGQISLMGKSVYNAEGERRVIQFPDSRATSEKGWIRLPDGSDKYTPTLQLTACYDFVTEASPVVCLAHDPYKILTQQACTPGTVTGGLGSQGAPVSVSSVVAENIRGQVIFRIHITNAQGTGRVIAPEALTNCPYNLDFIDMNLIDYRVSLEGGGIATSSKESSNSNSVPGCTPNRIRLTNGQADLFCRFTIKDVQSSAFQTVLQIKLNYAYLDSIQKTVEIRSIK